MKPHDDPMPPPTPASAPPADRSAAPHPTGDAPDLAVLVERHQADVWRYLRALGCDPALADDLTQDTFLQLLVSPFEHRGDAATAGWLRTTATSLLRKRLRRQRIVGVVAMDELHAAQAAWDRWHSRGDARADGSAVHAALADCLQQLTDRARTTLRLHYEEQRSGEELAAALDISHANVRVILHRARQTLRDCVDRKVASHE